MSGVNDNALLMLRELIRQHMNDIADDLADGSCRNFDQYRYMTGQINGLAMAERELLDLNRRIEEA